MAPSDKTIIGNADDDDHKCSMGVQYKDGTIVWFDYQAAEPGDFIVPGVVDVEEYQMDCIVQTYWVFIKGDMMAGPLPGHPYEKAFNDRVKFSLDLVKETNDGHGQEFIQNVMPPSNSSFFWEGAAPFHPWSDYTLMSPTLDKSCKYYDGAAMTYRWWSPGDLEEGSTY